MPVFHFSLEKNPAGTCRAVPGGKTRSLSLLFPEIDQATAEYRQSEDHVGRFLSECVILAPYATASKADFFAAYKKWCEEQGEHAVTQKKMGTYLTEKGFDSCR